MKRPQVKMLVGSPKGREGTEWKINLVAGRVFECFYRVERSSYKMLTELFCDRNTIASIIEEKRKKKQ